MCLKTENCYLKTFVEIRVGEKIFPVMQDEAGMGQGKTMRGGDEDPIL